MQAIETKIIPATNNKPTRIKARCERGSLTMSPPIHDKLWSSEENHVAVADALVARFVAEDENEYGTPPAKNSWALPRVCGGTKEGYAHVYLAQGSEVAK